MSTRTPPPAHDDATYAGFSDLDRHFAGFLQRVARKPSSELRLAAALASRSREEGHICLDLRRVAGTALPLDEAAGKSLIKLPELEPWMGALRESSVVGSPGELTPLVLDDRGRLYLHRYWQYEANLAAALRARAAREDNSVDEIQLAVALRRYFPPTVTAEIDWQKVAVFTALTRSFCVISGGPGTGKTHTVAVLLALLLEGAGGRPLRIALAAPTGKAAARLQETVRHAKAALPCDDVVKERLPEDASTLHRLLGTVRDSTFFKHNAVNPLPFDVVVIDEASMVDLALMAKVFAALPPHARLVLLGDRDQLASVEAGAVLGDICRGGPVNAFSDEARSRYLRVTGETLPAGSGRSTVLGDCIVQLQKNRRFGADNGILALSRAVNEGDADQALGLMRGSTSAMQTTNATVRLTPALSSSEAKSGGIAFARLPAEFELKETLRHRVLAAFGDAMNAPDPKPSLEAFSRFRILCALRQGPFGVENVNKLVEEILGEAGLIQRHDRWYAGRPVMVLQNDYNLRLFNGDIGIVKPDASGMLRAFFRGDGDEWRSVAPVRLPRHETVFAMTVHKSQGSEFDDVLLMLPNRDNPVLTRELIYTGITRASRRVALWSSEPVFRAALSRRVERTSGLSDALWR